MLMIVAVLLRYLSRSERKGFRYGFVNISLAHISMRLSLAGGGGSAVFEQFGGGIRPPPQVICIVFRSKCSKIAD